MLFTRLFNNAIPRDVPLVTAAIALSAFFASLLVALYMVADGHPAFLAIWSVITFAMAAYVRAHRRWRNAFERIYHPMPAMPATSLAGKERKPDVQDVVFRELSH
jgi:uncharacterized membrane protein